MSYSSCSVPGLYALRWGQTPELGDVAKYAAEIAAVHAKQGAQPIGLIIMPQDSKPPDEAFRKAQARLLPDIMSHLEYAICVFEGTGFMSSLKRSALVAIMMLSPRRQQVHVRASVQEALLSDPPRPMKFDVHKAIAELQRKGFLSPEALRATG